MWNKYEPPAEQQPDEPRPEPEQSQQPASWPRLGDGRPEAAPRRRYRPAPGHVVAGRSSASPVAALAGIIGIIAVAGVGFAAVGSSQSQERSEREAWDECIASYGDREPGLLSPADLCEIGHERPEGWADDEYDDGSIFDDDCESAYLGCDDGSISGEDYTYP